MKTLLVGPLVILGLLGFLQLGVSDGESQAPVPIATTIDLSASIASEEVLNEQRLEVFSDKDVWLLAGNVPCNPARQVCQE